MGRVRYAVQIEGLSHREAARIRPHSRQCAGQLFPQFESAVDCNGALKFDESAKPENCSIADTTHSRVYRISHTVAGMENILKIRLNEPFGNYRRLIGKFQRHLIV